MKLIQRQKEVLTPPRGGGLASWSDLNRIRNEIDRLFEDPASLLTGSTSFFDGWTPAVDIYEDEDKYIAKAHLPGMSLEDIELSLDGNNLTISEELQGKGQEQHETVHQSLTEIDETSAATRPHSGSARRGDQHAGVWRL